MMRTTAGRCLAAVVLTLVLGSVGVQAETLRVGKSTLTSFSYTMLEVGMHTGIFKRHGLEIESSAFGGGPRLLQAMTAGAIDIGLDGGTDMAMIVKGAPIMTIAPLSGAPLEMVIAVKHDSPLKTTSDLRGKKIAVTGAGTLTGWITRELVRSLGWTDRDVNYVMSSNIAASRALLQTGEIDAVTTDMTTTIENHRLGKERMLFNFGELVKDFHMQIIFAANSTIAAKPEAVRAFMAGWLETIAFAKANKEKTVEIIRQVLGFHPDVLNASYDRLINNYSTDGKFNPRALAVLARSYVELKLLDQEPDMAKLYTEAFLPKK
jgi:ABC-type nitrate/sulfonate/bicarbonate transport system substrate-binding protein